MPMGVESQIDPTEIDRLANLLITQLTTMGGVLKSKTDLLYVAAAVVMFVIAIMKLMYFRKFSAVVDFFKFYVVLMVLVLLSRNWNPVADGYTGYMARLGIEATGYNLGELTPSVVLAKGFAIMGQLYENGISFYRIFLGSGDDTVVGLIMLIAIFVFAKSVIDMVTVLVVSLVFFKISSVLALFLLPFALLEVTRFAAVPGLIRIVQYGIQFFIVSLIIGFAFMYMSTLTFSDRPDANEALVFAVAVGIFSTLMKHGMNLAKEHIAGTPMLSLREGANTVQGAMGSLTGSIQKLTGAMKEHSRVVGHGGGVGNMTSRAVSYARNNVRIGNSNNNTNSGAANPSPTPTGNTANTPQWAQRNRANAQQGAQGNRANTARSSAPRP